jgi:hypothetical protein
MTASNQLLDWVTLRSLVDTDVSGGRYVVWVTSDPGTGTLPDHRISTVGELIAYFVMSDLGQNHLLCPDFSTIQSMITAFDVTVSNLTAVSDANQVDFDLGTVGAVPSGTTYEFDILVDGSIVLTSSGVPGHITRTVTLGGSTVRVDLRAIHLFSTIATDSASTPIT